MAFKDAVFGFLDPFRMEFRLDPIPRRNYSGQDQSYHWKCFTSCFSLGAASELEWVDLAAVDVEGTGMPVQSDAGTADTDSDESC